MELIYAIILGTAFGFVLQRVGAADPDKIIGMLNLTDLHLAKAILSAIGIASAVFFAAVLLGLVGMDHVSIKAMYWGVLPGGALLGLGWALSGYCPGTGIVAAGAGRMDGVFFILGGLVGAGIFTVRYHLLKGTWWLEELFGGKTSLVQTGSSNALIDTSWSPVVAISIGVAFIVMALVLPKCFRRNTLND